VPRPVTGSQSFTALKPLVLQPGLLPVVICLVSKSIHHGSQITHISKGMRVLIQSRVYESNCALACSKTFFVDQGNDRGKNGSRSTGTTNKRWLTIDVEKDVQTDSRDIRVPATGLVVIRVAIGGQVIRRWRIFEVFR
jgi:hypothetical protein